MEHGDSGASEGQYSEDYRLPSHLCEYAVISSGEFITMDAMDAVDAMNPEMLPYPHSDMMTGPVGHQETWPGSLADGVGAYAPFLPSADGHHTTPLYGSTVGAQVAIPREVEAHTRRSRTWENTTDSSVDKTRRKNRLKPKSQWRDAERSPSRLACPFYKTNPGKYQYSGACAGPGFLTVYRLKEHLFRRHATPKFWCEICFEGFDDRNECADHIQSYSCHAKPSTDRPDWFSEQQARDLRPRKFGGETEEEKWKVVFQILFPSVDENQIPDPHHIDIRLADHEGPRGLYSDEPNRELPASVRKVVDGHYDSLRKTISGILHGRDMGLIETQIQEALSLSHHESLNSLAAVYEKDSETLSPRTLRGIPDDHLYVDNSEEGIRMGGAHHEPIPYPYEFDTADAAEMTSDMDVNAQAFGRSDIDQNFTPTNF